MAITAANYLIRSALNENLVLQTSAGSKSKGAVITAGALTELDNRCYWKVTVKNTSYNNIQNINAGGSGNMIAAATAGANVMQGAAMNWTVEASGNTMTVNGVSVPTYFVKTGSLFVTVPNNGGNLYLAEALSDTTNQEFCFESTTYVNLKLATPSELRTEEGNTYIIASGAKSFYPSWKAAKAATIWEMRYRTRCWDMDGNAADDWSGWTAWTMIQATAQLNEKKKYSGVMVSNTAITTPAGVDNSTYSRAAVQIQVRLVSATTAAKYNHTSNVTHGAAVDQTINQWCTPSLSISTAVYSPDGLALAYATNYTIPGSAITINKITDRTTETILLEDYEFVGQDYSGVLYLNCNELYSIPAAGDSLQIVATIIEENRVAKRTITVNLAVSYDQHWGLTFTPKYLITDRMTVQAKAPSYATLQLYMERPQLDGTTRWVECDKISDDGNTTVFEFAPPYNNVPNLMWVAVDSSENWTSALTVLSGATVDGEDCSWFWIDQQGNPRVAILKYRSGGLVSPADTITLPANKFITTGREYPVFRYAKSVERVLDVEGSILEDDDEYCRREDFEALAAANHCIFRQPDGKWYQVAITAITFTRYANYTGVLISQEAETR